MSTAVLEQPTKLDLQETPPFPVMRLTLQQYWDLRESGFFEQYEVQYELLQGWLVPKMPQNPSHALVVFEINRRFSSSLPKKWLLRTQSSITTADSEPEPDGVVALAPITRYASRHPRGEDIGLLIEVADSSLSKDRRKGEIYAAEGIPVYWIINLVDRQIEVYTQPDAANSKYRHQETRSPGESVTFELDGEVVQTIAVDDLLPPVES